MNISKRERFWFFWERFGIVVFLVVTLAVFAILTKGVVLNLDNVLTVVSRSAQVGIAACGMTFAICAGGFDLSVSSILGLSTCVFAANLANIGLIPATILTLTVGALCGLLNGLVITKLKIQTFVATLSMGMIIKGAALLYTKGSKQLISRDKNPEIKVFSQSITIGSLTVQLVPILMLIAVAVVGYLVYKYTRFGVYSRSIGSFEPAARTSNIPVDRTLIIIFIVTGVTTSIAGLIRTSQLIQGAATLGDGFALEVITATILGGTALSGGKGNIFGSAIGAILLALVGNGLNILGQKDEIQRLAIGLILIVALMICGIRELTLEAKK